MREVVGSIPTATTMLFLDFPIVFRGITLSHQSNEQISHRVTLGIFAPGRCPQTAPRICPQVPDGMFHALGHCPGVECSRIETRMAHQIHNDLRVAYLRRHLGREVIS